ncbi:unnamed protein product [Urochloa humidicola]
MGLENAESVFGKYRLGRTVGEGTFAKVRLAADAENGGAVAVKVIDRETVLKNNLMYQVKREIRAMKLLSHPNIVRIHEVIATKTKICLAMEYVSGGQLSDKLSHLKRLDERGANKCFYQLIDAVDYCHRRGVYHRDLKPENLLLDNQGNLKVSDFGLSALTTPGQLLSTSCGSPCYIAPEDRSLASLYRSISLAQFTFSRWFTALQKKLISKILDPSPIRRAKIGDIFKDKWLHEDYNASRIDDENDGSDLEEVSTESESSHNSEVREAAGLNPEPEPVHQRIPTDRNLQ